MKPRNKEKDKIVNEKKENKRPVNKKERTFLKGEQKTKMPNKGLTGKKKTGCKWTIHQKADKKKATKKTQDSKKE